jgi:hypothetical protein
MSLHLDHAFITCEVGAPEAEVLLSHGFVEGSRNVHHGQGTANRRFFFANFMLELFWVSDPAEAASDRVRDTGLWERWSRRKAGASRFGIAYGGAPAAGAPPPFTTQPYFPAYAPPGLSLEVVHGLQLREPALFYLPWLQADRERREPIEHAVPVRTVTGIAIGLPDLKALSSAACRVRDAGMLSFIESASPLLEVQFLDQQARVIDCRPDLPLIFRGSE